ncbi:MAG TPA: response regulator [Candidatus Omnitrophota bacterium]|nr:response regulator [Candidatus Omnitrophota bacterium]
MPGEKILAIDDNQDILDCLQVQLKRRGYQVWTANNGEEGLKKAENEIPDLILLDIKMPTMDGLTFMRRLRRFEDLRKIPIVVMTGYEPMRDMFQFEGVTDFVVKTGDMNDIYEAIKRNLHKIPQQENKPTP